MNTGKEKKKCLRIKLQQQQQKTSSLFVDAACKSTIQIAILNWYSFSNHAGFKYEQMKCSMVILINKTCQCLDVILFERVKPRIAPMKKTNLSIAQ